MVKNIEIGDIKVKPGEKKSGFIKIGDGSVSNIGMPVTIINSREEGPTLCVTSGTHPCEFAGVAAVLRLCDQIRPEKLKGAIIAIPIISMMAFQNRTPYINPIDGLNIEKVYPGKSDGSISEKIAYTVLENIVKKADFAIDCHGGDLDEMMYNNTWFPSIGDEKIDTASEALARIYGLEYICLQSMNDGMSNRNIESAKRDVPAIQTECGSVGMLRKVDFDTHYMGITNVMKYLGMIEGTPKINVKQKIVKSVIRIKTRSGGIFFPKVDLGETVSKGQIIGEIKNFKGETIDEIISPDDGVMRKIFTHQAVHTGRLVLEIFASPEPVPPFPQIDQFYEKNKN